MKKITKLLLVSASMILASCGGGEKPAESKPVESTPTSSKVESSSKPAASSSKQTTSSSKPAASSQTPAASSQETPIVGAWQNDGDKVGEAQPVKNVSANLKGYELVASGKEVASGKWDNGKLKGDLEWGVAGMTAGKYQVYLKAGYSSGNGSADFHNNGDVPTDSSRYTFQADAENEAVIASTESYSDLGFGQGEAGADWSNKALAEVEIKAGTQKFAVRYHATGYSIYLTGVRLVKVGDAAGGSSTPAASTPESTPASTPDSTPESSEPPVVAGQGTVTLSDGASSLSEGADGITVDNTTNEIHFTKLGEYVVSGALTNGSLVVDESAGEGAVNITLEGASIGRSGEDTSAPIVAKHIGKLKVKKGKTAANTITDTRTFTEAALNTAAIYAKGYLDMPGKGTLTITTNGIGMQAGEKIETKNGKLNITAGNKGICAPRSILIGEEGGEFNVTATASHAVEVEAVEGATFLEDELQGVKIDAATVKLNLTGGKKAINSDYPIEILGGKGTMESTSADRAINAKSDLKMSGGEYTYKSGNKNAIQADVGATVSGGKHIIESDAEGFVSKKDIEITGGELQVTKATKGIEANHVKISGDSVVDIKATSKGISAVTKSSQTTAPSISIEGGKTFVEAAGNGLDSSGSVIVAGGTTIINETGAGKQAIAFAADGAFTQNGGLLVAYGTGAAPVNTGTQRSVIASSTVGVTNEQFFKVANGTTNYFIQPQSGTANQLYVSSPDFTNGTVTVSKLASATAGILEFKGVYSSATAEGEATVLGTGTFADNALHLDTTPAA